MASDKEKLQLFRQIHKMVEISQLLMQFCYIEPLVERFRLRRSEFAFMMRLYTLTLEQPEGVSLKALTSVLKVSQSAASMLVGSLLQKGLICRNVNPEDRRQALLTLAPEVRPQFDAMAMAQSESAARVLADLPEAKKESFNALIDEVYAYVMEHSPEGE